MVGQQLSQTNEKCYSIRRDPFYHYFTDLNTACVSFRFFFSKQTLPFVCWLAGAVTASFSDRSPLNRADEDAFDGTAGLLVASRFPRSSYVCSRRVSYARLLATTVFWEPWWFLPCGCYLGWDVTRCYVPFSCLVWLVVVHSFTDQLDKLFGPCLVVKIKNLNLSHRIRILYAWSIKSKQNKKLIIQFACKLRDQSNEPN